MPAIHDYSPADSPKFLQRRIDRAKRMSHYLAVTEPVRIACRVRGETRASEKLLDSAFEVGLAMLPDILDLMAALDRHRGRMLDILGAPKRPGRPMVDERTVRMIRDAMPEEILVAEPEIEPPPAPVKPPST